VTSGEMTYETKTWRHRLAHWLCLVWVEVVEVDGDGWITRACATCGKRYRPALPCWPL